MQLVRPCRLTTFCPILIFSQLAHHWQCQRRVTSIASAGDVGRFCKNTSAIRAGGSHTHPQNVCTAHIHYGMTTPKLLPKALNIQLKHGLFSFKENRHPRLQVSAMCKRDWVNWGLGNMVFKHLSRKESMLVVWRWVLYLSGFSLHCESSYPSTA